MRSTRRREDGPCRGSRIRPARRLCLLGLVALLSALEACCTSRAERPFPIEVLLLDGASFPLHGVETRDSDPPGPSGSCHRAGREYFTHLHLGLQDIYEYNSAEKASRSIAWHESIVFGENSSTESWATPPELAFQSVEADYLQQKCAVWRGDIWVCAVVAQYGEYVFRLSLDLYPGSLTLSGFEQVVQAMDERAVRYLK